MIIINSLIRYVKLRGKFITFGSTQAWIIVVVVDVVSTITLKF